MSASASSRLTVWHPSCAISPPPIHQPAHLPPCCLVLFERLVGITLRLSDTPPLQECPEECWVTELPDIVFLPDCMYMQTCLLHHLPCHPTGVPVLMQSFRRSHREDAPVSGLLMLSLLAPPTCLLV
mgnify:CR=1 FL=1